MSTESRACITLTSGREIRLDELRQDRMYRALLAGYPTRESNDHILVELTKPTDINAWGAPTHVIQPVQRPIERILQRRRENPRPSDAKCGFPAELPPICCLAYCESSEIENCVSGEDGCSSHLVIAWFQDDFAFPIDPMVLHQIQALDWDKLARNFSP